MEREFISKDLNYEYYKLNNHDYNDYLFQLNNYEIEYLDELNIDKSITFGIEIEYERIKEDIVDQFIEYNYSDWKSTYEKTINKGGEIISPILNDSKSVWKDLKRICEFLKINDALMDNEAGAHIHVGTSILGNDINKWHNLIGLYTAFEEVLYRFTNGERINPRKNIKVFAYPISIDLAKIYQSILNTNNVSDLPLLLDTEHRFQGLNFNNTDFNNPETKDKKNTIEYRMPNGTDEEIIWQNNINTLIHLTKAHINKDQLAYIKEEIEYIQDNYYNYEHYSYIDPKKAFLLADIIFDNNLYKTNFLRQYIKDMKTTDKNTPIYAKRFIKTIK